MHLFTQIFIVALLAGLGLQLWLLGRQIRAVHRHREQVPAPFASQVSLEQHQRAADYTTALASFARVHLVFDAMLLLALTLGGGIAAIDQWVEAFGFAGIVRGVAVIAAVALLSMALELPFGAWRTFRIESRFGFNRSTPGLFAMDQVKGLAIAAVLMLPLLALLLWLFERAGEAWWLWAFAVWAAFSLAITWAWPRVFAPLFNKFRALEEGELRSAVETLARRCGFEPQGVHVMDGSRRSSHGNAYFTGFGRNKRIVFFDTLLDGMGTSEVAAVLAHELGHFRLHHVAWRIVVSLLTALAGFALLAWLARQDWFQPALGISDGGSHTLLLLFALAMPVFLLPLAPLGAAWSRRHEFEADAYAASHADARALASALVKLHRDNATTLTPDSLYSAFHASHPPALERIGRLQVGSAA